MKLSLCSTLFAMALLCPSGYAQTTSALADVPFNFQVGDTTMPAGKYAIQDKGGVLTVRQIGGPNSVFRLTFPVSRSTRNTDPKLAFTRYGEDYHLAVVWGADSRDGQALILSKHEKELSSRFRTVETASVALRSTSR